MFEVEWCSDMPIDENGDADIDNAVLHQSYFRTKAAAEKYAIKMLPQDYYGSIRIIECHEECYEPGLPGKYLEYDGESEWINATDYINQ